METKKIENPIIYVRNPRDNKFVRFPSVGAISYDDADIRNKIKLLEDGKQDKGEYLTKDDLNTAVEPISNKEYFSSDFSGYGRINLPKNKGILTQKQIPTNQVNTIFVIQYNYTLNNQSITLPTGSILLFNGGSIKNGTIVGNKTTLINLMDNYPYSNVKFEGTFNNFGTSGNRPNLSLGKIYKDTDLNKFFIKDLTDWKELKTQDIKAKSIGNSNEKPSSNIIDNGFTFYDKTEKRLLIWDGEFWVDVNGYKSNTKTYTILKDTNEVNI